MSDLNNWNAKIIEEFRANAGKVGGPFEGHPMLLLHTTGAKTGEERVNPLAYQPDGDKFVIFASYAGADKNPAWFHNLTASPDVTVELRGGEKRAVRARVVEGDERERWWKRAVADYRLYEDYATYTDRRIPVVLLERR